MKVGCLYVFACICLKFVSNLTKKRLQLHKIESFDDKIRCKYFKKNPIVRYTSHMNYKVCSW